ncbi:MAG: hypothetical protein HYV97_04105 [Bdellovibrio sp.]|nr:hypothetical protein [Bdellovibrio sp.]
MNLYILIAFFIIFTVSAFAIDEYSWQDGEQSRKIYLKSNLLVHFGKTKTLPGDRLHKKIGNASIYKTTNEAVTLAISQRSSPPNQSPIFSDGPDGTGTLRALPGGVIVTFKQPRLDSEVQTWAQKNKLTLQRKINISGKTVWLVKTKAGFDSLNQATLLAQNEDVKTASPNWWTPVGARPLILNQEHNSKRPIIRETFDTKKNQYKP